jgi:hypothetical protein
MMRKTLIMLAMIFVMVIAWGCKEKPAWKGSIEIVDGVQVVRNPKAPLFPEGALELQEELTIGAAEGDEEYMFARLRWIAVDDQGTIFALDQRKRRVDVFSPDGRHIRSIGGPGQGPGEFQNPYFITLAPAEEILVGEMGRLSFFDVSGHFVRSRDNTARQLAFAKYLESGNVVATRMVLDEKSSRYEVVVCGPDMEPKTALASSLMPDPYGKIALITSVIRWDISRSREIVCGSGEGDYRLTIHDAEGRVIRTIHKDYEPVPVTEWDIERMMKRHGIQSREDVAAPRFLPPILWVYADEDGRIFVSTWQRNRDRGVALFNIFDAEGRYLGDHFIPGEPLVFKNGKLYAIVEDEGGFQYIKRYRMIWKT